MKHMTLTPLVVLLSFSLLLAQNQRPKAGEAEAREPKTATGVVFQDTNENRKMDPGEKPLEHIRVSNRRSIAQTDQSGRYRIQVDEDDIIFVIKPSGWRTPLTEDNLPQFYYIHKPAGSPPSRYAGVAPTGPLPESIDFPLYPQEEPDAFQVILFADPQPRDLQEIGYVTHDVIEELIGTRASFGVTLGDIMFDDLSLFETQNRAIALLGIPWYNVIGNHDLNFEAATDSQSDESFERVYGPSYYSFDYGPVHFLVLDDVEWFVPAEEAQNNLLSIFKGTYRGGLGPEQLEFIRNDLRGIPEDQLVVLMMHMPLTDVRDRQELYRLIENRPFSVSLSGHLHTQEHRFISSADGWHGREPHHHLVNVTVSGSWWSGAPDERGIPHAMMMDGAPNGYTILNIDGNRYTIDYKAAGRGADYQMAVYAPDEVTSSEAGDTVIYVNVFAGSERSTVEMRLGDTGEWIALRQSNEPDPQYTKLVQTENSPSNRAYRNLFPPRPSTHIWRASLPTRPKPGVYALHVRTKDMFGRAYEAARIIRVQ